MMLKWYIRYRDTIIPLLAVVIATLVLANLIKHGALTASRLKDNKDALAALQSVVQVIVLSLGAIFSYYRFFRGRTFVSRADVALDVQVFATETDDYLHAIAIEFRNLGTVSIFDPQPVLNIRYYGPSDIEDEHWTNWREARLPGRSRLSYAVVDSGETASYSASHAVPNIVWAVEYTAFITDADGITWKRSVTVENRAKSAA
jgi:hypothetical protein